MPIRSVHSGVMLLATLAVAGCKDSNAPRDPLGIFSVIVTERVDSAALRDSGELTLALVPVDGRGRAILSDTLSIDPVLAGATLPVVRTVATEPGPNAVSAAVLMDNSASMRTSDPDNLRLQAARLFFDGLLGPASGNEGALLSFSGATPSAGLSATRLEQTWTSSAATLDAAIDASTAIGASRLYTSATETLNWIDSTRPSTARRVLVLFTDGLPDDTAVASGLFAAAASAGVVVHAVGVGPASNVSSNTSAAAVARLREIANQTDGLYAGAPSAAGLSPVLTALAGSVSEGELLVTVKLEPAPARGTVLRGYVDVSNPAGGARGSWEVTVP